MVWNDYYCPPRGPERSTEYTRDAPRPCLQRSLRLESLRSGLQAERSDVSRIPVVLTKTPGALTWELCGPLWVHWGAPMVALSEGPGSLPYAVILEERKSSVFHKGDPLLDSCYPPLECEPQWGYSLTHLCNTVSGAHTCLRNAWQTRPWMSMLFSHFFG